MQLLGALAAAPRRGSGAGRGRIAADAREVLTRLARNVVPQHDPLLRHVAELLLLAAAEGEGEGEGNGAAEKLRAALAAVPLGSGDTAARYDGTAPRRRDRLLETRDDDGSAENEFESSHWSWRDFFGGTAATTAGAAMLEADAPEAKRGALPTLLFGPGPGGDGEPDARWMAATMRPTNLAENNVARVAAPKCTVDFGRDASAMLAVAACV